MAGRGRHSRGRSHATAPGALATSTLRLSGQATLITGGTSGIGARTPELFVAQGGRVVVAGRRRDKGEELVARLGDAASFVRADVTLEGDVRAMIEHAMHRFGRVDSVFNNAGALSSRAGVTGIALANFDAAVASHVRSVLAGMKHALPIMRRQRSGSIINMGSTVGIRAGIGGGEHATGSAARRGRFTATRILLSRALAGVS